MIGVMDADFLYRKSQRFPNLCSMKISAWHKQQGDDVKLITNISEIADFSKVYVSKVFTDTKTPDILEDDCVQKLIFPTTEIIRGGTGFHFDKAEPLPYEVEHIMPDYSLYDGYADADEYKNHSIGYLTRGCFRKCGFCVNQKYDHVFRASELEEFYDPKRKKICLLDDNFFGWKHWKSDLQKLIDTGKPFIFKQGLDERLLTDEKCEMLFNAKYAGDFTFAFDNIEDYDLIKSKLEMIRRHYDGHHIKFYVLVGFNGNGIDDISNMFKRIELLRRNRVLPYIMRYRSQTDSPCYTGEFSRLYSTVARWCNQPSFFRKETLWDYTHITDQKCMKSDKMCASAICIEQFVKDYPEMSHYVFSKYGE